MLFRLFCILIIFSSSVIGYGDDGEGEGEEEVVAEGGGEEASGPTIVKIGK